MQIQYQKTKSPCGSDWVIAPCLCPKRCGVLNFTIARAAQDCLRSRVKLA